MATFEILKMGNPILRKIAGPVKKEEITSNETKELINKMFATMEKYEGIGLAAPQVGISKQIAIIEVPIESERYPDEDGSETFVIFNPSIKVIEEETQSFWEGCLSIPGIRAMVPRPRKIQVDYLDQDAKEQSIVLEDFLATVFQHELDHLFGKLFVDRVTDTKTLCFEEEFEKMNSELD